MKFATATLVAFALLTGASVANARTQGVFTDLNTSAPKTTFDTLQDSAPRSAFDDLNQSAPRSVFDGIRDSAPRSGTVRGTVGE